MKYHINNRKGTNTDNFILPEKWCVKITPESKQSLGEWRDSGILISDEGYCLSYYKGHKGWRTDRLEEGYPEITFEQFKKYVLKQNDMEKEIIGYRLKDDFKQYEKVAVSIASDMDEIFPNLEYYLERNLEYYLERKVWGKFKERLEKAGVLDLWFEPVYAEEKPEFKIGQWVWCEVANWPYMGKLISINPISMDMWQAKSNTTFNDGGTFNKITRLATEEEIKTHLIELAKQKGFFEGLPFNRIQSWTSKDLNYTGYSGKIDNTQWNYNFSQDELCNLGAPIYKKGKWATIVPTKKTFKVEHGEEEYFTVDITPEGIYYNSTLIKVSDLEQLIAPIAVGAWTANKNSFTIGCKVDISLQTLRELIKEAKSLQ